MLQETVIIKVKKTTDRPELITVSTSQSNGDFSELTSLQVPYRTVVQGPAHYVYLVTNEQEVQTLTQLSHLTDTLPTLGLKMRTGLTVDYRNQDALRAHAESNAVPLFYAHHLKKGQVQFPLGKEPEYLVTTQKSLLQKNSNYLFVKRFTAKEEPRRLQCAIYLARNFPQFTHISTDNKTTACSMAQPRLTQLKSMPCPCPHLRQLQPWGTRSYKSTICPKLLATKSCRDFSEHQRRSYPRSIPAKELLHLEGLSPTNQCCPLLV